MTYIRGTRRQQPTLPLVLLNRILRQRENTNNINTIGRSWWGILPGTIFQEKSERIWTKNQNMPRPSCYMTCANLPAEEPQRI